MKTLQDYAGAAQRIKELQRADGSITWVDAGVFDPWNHTESAMALTVAGEYDAALKAYRRLAETQNKDGSWWADYGNAAPLDGENEKMMDADKPKVRDTNYSAYIATGAWHYFVSTQDKGFLKDYMPVVDRAMAFVLAHQSEHGDIRWAAVDPHTPEDDALLTGCSSIYKSLECAIRLFDAGGAARQDWAAARASLGDALRNRPDRFDRNWASKQKYSMDWYYPALSGALSKEASIERLKQRWDEFVVEGIGCRCVAEEPWATVAEACELAMALLKHGDRTRAEALFEAQHRCRDEVGAYWMGYQFAEKVFWPGDKPSWTAAAVLLAGDALYDWTPASKIFTGPALAEA
ncbi:MAG: prenyltransferase [Pseudomonadota bacterium]